MSVQHELIQGETWIDAAIGETRHALVREGRPIALRIVRRSGEGRRARWGESYVARIASVDRRRRGVFVDLGLKDEQGFLPLNAGGLMRGPGGAAVPVREGESVVVTVKREAARDKSPVVEMVAPSYGAGAPHRLARHESDTDLDSARPADPDTRAKLEALIEDLLAPTAPVPGGGVLRIEPTAALVAIDVDAGARAGSGDPERFALDLNIAAAREAARQLRLRNLGGVIAIDFVSLRSKAHRALLEQGVREAFADDPWGVQFGGLSRFGVFELSRGQYFTPLHEQLCDGDGRLSAETVALAALRAIEREARASTGRQIAGLVAPDVKGWLDSAPFDWRGELENRIGVRWSLDAAPANPVWPRDKIEARAL